MIVLVPVILGLEGVVLVYLSYVDDDRLYNIESACESLLSERKQKEEEYLEDRVEPELGRLVEKLSKKFVYPERALKGFIQLKMSQGKTREQAIREIEKEHT